VRATGVHNTRNVNGRQRGVSRPYGTGNVGGRVPGTSCRAIIGRRYAALADKSVRGTRFGGRFSSIGVLRLGHASSLRMTDGGDGFADRSVRGTRFGGRFSSIGVLRLGRASSLRMTDGGDGFADRSVGCTWCVVEGSVRGTRFGRNGSVGGARSLFFFRDLAEGLKREAEGPLHVAGALVINHAASLREIEMVEGEHNGAGVLEQGRIVGGAAGQDVVGTKTEVPVAEVSTVDARGTAGVSAVHDVVARPLIHKCVSFQSCVHKTKRGQDARATAGDWPALQKQKADSVESAS